MSRDTQPEASARLRFQPKKVGEGRSAVWRVYDLQNGSFPYRTPELGEVVQDKPEVEIQAECDRLTAAHGYVSDAKKAAAGRTATKTASIVADPDDDDEDAEDSVEDSIEAGAA